MDLSQIFHHKTHSKGFDAPPDVGSTGPKFVLEKGEKLDQSTLQHEILYVGNGLGK
jgi:hypothetical protein